MDVTEDTRCGEFNKAVRKKCVEKGMCTNQTTINIYYQNKLMSPNLMIRKDHDAKKRYRPLPKVIRATDGTQSATGEQPQSRPCPVPNDVGGWSQMVAKLIRQDYGCGWWHKCTR